MNTDTQSSEDVKQWGSAAVLGTVYLSALLLLAGRPSH
jgi:hypothetical protein